jgi:hypothetical protein
MDNIMRLATEKEKFAILSPPNTLSALATARVPYRLRLSWKPAYTISAFVTHKIIVPHVEGVFKAIHHLCTPEEIKDAGMDIWGGCHNVRAIRGTERKASPPWSAHAFGAAIDMDPLRNGLWTRTPKAHIAQDKYKKIRDIWQDHGFINLGNVIDRDWMHWEASYELIKDPAKWI